MRSMLHETSYSSLVAAVQISIVYQVELTLFENIHSFVSWPLLKGMLGIEITGQVALQTSGSIK